MPSDMLLAACLLSCTVALLVAPAVMRLAQLHHELQTMIDRSGGVLLSEASQLYSRRRLLSQTMVGLLLAGLFLGVAVVAGLFSDLWPQASMWAANVSAAGGCFFLAGSGIQLFRECMKSLKVIKAKLRTMIEPKAAKKSKVEGPMRVIFEFAGGPLDGKTVEGRLGDQGEAERFFLITHRGSLGQRFKLASDYAVEILSQTSKGTEVARLFQNHVYVVTDRLDGENEVLVRAEYAPRG